MVLGQGADQLFPLNNTTLDVFALDLKGDHVEDRASKALVGLRVVEFVQQPPTFASTSLRTQYHRVRSAGGHCLQSVEKYC